MKTRVKLEKCQWCWELIHSRPTYLDGKPYHKKCLSPEALDRLERAELLTQE